MFAKGFACVILRNTIWILLKGLWSHEWRKIVCQLNWKLTAGKIGDDVGRCFMKLWNDEMTYYDVCGEIAWILVSLLNFGDVDIMWWVSWDVFLISSWEKK